MHKNLSVGPGTLRDSPHFSSFCASFCLLGLITKICLGHRSERGLVLRWAWQIQANERLTYVGLRIGSYAASDLYFSVGSLAGQVNMTQARCPSGNSV